jgi:RNA polymerase-binding transcription factor DksA
MSPEDEELMESEKALEKQIYVMNKDLINENTLELLDLKRKILEEFDHVTHKLADTLSNSVQPDDMSKVLDLIKMRSKAHECHLNSLNSMIDSCYESINGQFSEESES